MEHCACLVYSYSVLIGKFQEWYARKIAKQVDEAEED